jgi:rhamnulokinase
VGHDTAAAMAAIPAQGSASIYISCGTMSLIGFPSDSPIVSRSAYEARLNNYGDMFGHYLLLRSTNGLWLLQECQRVWRESRPSPLEHLLLQASLESPLGTVLDLDSGLFVKPQSMPSAIADYCRATEQRCPESEAQFVRTILESLAVCWLDCIQDIRSLRPTPPNCIHIVGGASRNTLLCDFIAAATGLPVLAGPQEASSMGNIIGQLLALGHLASYSDVQSLLCRSVSPRLHQSQQMDYFLELLHKLHAMRRRPSQ